MPNIKETISQVLSPTNATYVNGVSVRRNFSKAVLKAIYQELVEKDGKGVNNKFVTEQEANDAGQVFVNRLKAHDSLGREHGAAKNGGAFNNNGYMSHTETVGIEILTYFDEPIIVPRVAQDRIDIDLASGEIANYVANINTALNGSSWAAKWMASYNTTSANRNEKKLESATMLNDFIAANTLLDLGDMEHDIDSFPLDTRIATFKMGYRPTLIAAGVLVIGGANYGYDIARKGTLDASTEKRNLDDGFWGVIDSVPVHGLSNKSLMHAAYFCGLPKMEFINDDSLVGWISSGYANARGFSTVEQVKIIDAHGGQGVEIQPLSKMGAVSWYPKGNVALTTVDGYDPIADLKTIFSGVASQVTFKLKGGASRYYADDAALTVSTTAVTANGTAKDDAGTDHLKAAYYVVTTAQNGPVKSIAGFIAAVNADGAVKDSLTIGTSKNFASTQSAGKYVNVVYIADDGTCTLVSKAIAS